MMQGNFDKKIIFTLELGVEVHKTISNVPSNGKSLFFNQVTPYALLVEQHIST